METKLYKDSFTIGDKVKYLGYSNPETGKIILPRKGLIVEDMRKLSNGNGLPWMILAIGDGSRITDYENRFVYDDES